VSQSNHPTFAVVIPAFNEEAGIRAAVEAVDEALGKLPNETAIIVVDDGSVDRTGAELANVAEGRPRVLLVRHPTNRGYGAALRSGALRAASREFDYVLFMDSDLTNDPTYLTDFAEKMQEGFDVIKASRYIAGGGVDGVPWMRVLASKLGNRVARALFGVPVHDCTNGFRALRTTLVTSIDLHEEGFAVIMEELYRVQRLSPSYAEVPIILTVRDPYLRPSSFSLDPIAMMRYLKYPLLEAIRRRRK
jgi:dolichol-phosphate mannosyltransferase